MLTSEVSRFVFFLLCYFGVADFYFFFFSTFQDNLKDKEKELRKLENERAAVAAAYNKEHGNLGETLKAYRRELEKIRRIEEHIYNSAGQKAEERKEDRKEKKLEKKEEKSDKSALNKMKEGCENAKKKLKKRVENMEGYKKASACYNNASSQYKKGLEVLKRKLCASGAELKRRIRSSELFKRAVKIGQAIKARYASAKEQVSERCSGATEQVPLGGGVGEFSYSLWTGCTGQASNQGEGLQDLRRGQEARCCCPPRYLFSRTNLSRDNPVP